MAWRDFAEQGSMGLGKDFDAVPELLRLRFSCLVSLLSFGEPPTSNEICQKPLSFSQTNYATARTGN